ncbi:universal stress protein [Frateuria terrea]|nr:universal stress protein [Frateuria terrea]
MLRTNPAGARGMTELIVNVAEPEREAPLIDYAFSLARQWRAWLTGLCVVPVDALVMALPDSLGVLASEERDALADDAWWQARCRKAAVAGSWEVVCGVYRKVVAERASLANLVIGRLPGWPASLQDASRRLAETLVHGGCPIIVVPDDWIARPALGHVLLAWNGSAPSARAARAALPLLHMAHRVTVLDGTQGAGKTAAPLREWLARQDVQCDWQPFKPRADVGEAIHQEADRLCVDLLVQGAWGRRRTSERLLGGATRHSLRHSRVPLLLAP